jgi:hypothetical protein
VDVRLFVSEVPDLTTIRVVGGLDDRGEALLADACARARPPVVLDLSELTSANDAGVRLLRRLAGEGVHLLGASRYVRLLLDQDPALAAPASRRRRGPPSWTGNRTRPRGRP